MVVMAHPDDPDFGAGGSVARFADGGSQVTYVIITDGRQGGEDPKQKDSELIAIRQREQRAAAKVLGVKHVEFLGYKDGHLAPDLKLRRDIVKMIRKHKPDLVITQSPGRVLESPRGSHPDHLAAGEATMAAVYPDSRNPRAFRSLLKEGFPPHVVSEVWIPYWTQGDYFVDVTSTIDKKIEALRQHKSQPPMRSEQNGSFARSMRKFHRQTGKRAGFRYAESFKRITI